MAFSKVSHGLEILGAIVLLLSAVSGLNRGESCESITTGSEICSRIFNCPSRVKEILDNIYDEKSEYNSYFEKYSCGMESEEHLICCESPTETEVPEDVSQHPNLPLLRQDICGPVYKDRITNNNAARVFELPWMALLISKSVSSIEYGCVGSVISDRYVLTTAQCIENFPSTEVRLGEHTLHTDVDCEDYIDGENITRICAPEPQDIRIEDIILYPSYEGKLPYYGDIALARLEVPADFTTNAVRPICLPIGLSQQGLNLTGKMVDIAGWSLYEKGNHSNELMRATIPTVMHDKCPYWPLPSTHTQICAGNDVDGADTCVCDSGTPLTYVGEVEGSLRTLQYGIASYTTDRCGPNGQISVYTHVGHYMKWILDNMTP